MTLFQCSLHLDPASNIHKYLRHAGAVLAMLKRGLGLRTVHGCKRGRFAQSFMYHANMVVVTIEVDTVVIDVVNPESVLHCS